MNPDEAPGSSPTGQSVTPATALVGGFAWRWLSRQKIFFQYQANHFSAYASRGMNSLRLRGLVPTLRIAANRLFPPRRQPYTLLLYSDIGKQPEVQLPVVEPVVSIIVPVHNQLQYTLRCLVSLAASGDRTPFEVILIDDASTDDSAQVLPGIAGLRYQRNAHNAGFIASCNAGAQLARGQFLVFLNNDTVVQPGWLDPLIDTFHRHPDTGLAGSKLIYPDGRLQEAGGLLFANALAANFGRNDDPCHPRYNFVREADYCSGAALAIRGKLFADIGGFDSHYRPAYFEDTELAMRVRALGLKVRYQPASVVVHFEGASSGTDVRTGVKSHQVLNQEKFAQRWGSLLADQHPAYDPLDVTGMAAAIASTHRSGRRILIIDSYTPTPDRDSGSVRMTELMRLLLQEGCSVVFFSQAQSHDGGYTDALQQMGVEVWWQPWIGNLPGWLARHGARFDAIIVSRHYVLSPLLLLLRSLAPQAKLVFDTVDLHFLREKREAQRSGDAAELARAAITQDAEMNLIHACDCTWVVSEFERALLAPIAPKARIEVVSNIHGIRSDAPDFHARRDVLFVGSFRHPPNVDAASWLVREIWPRVHQARPDIRLHLVGADAPASVQALGCAPGVVFHGHVADLESLLDRSRISLAPLRFGAGIKGKINQALARGLPVIGTACAVEGMFLTDGQDVLSADEPAQFADAVLRLYQDPGLWQQLSAAGIENTRRHFSREAARTALRAWLDWLPARR